MILVYDIVFYKVDENDEEVLNKDGTTKQFRLRDGIRFKPLEYLCEDMEEEMLEPIRNKECSCGTHEELIDGTVVYYEKCR